MRVLTIFLIISLLYLLTACYSTSYVPRGDNVRKSFKNSKEVYLYSLDKSYYFARPSGVIFIADTLYGTGKVLIEDEPGPTEEVKIAVRDIYSLRVRSFDTKKTSVLVGAGILVIVLIKMSNPFKFKGSSFLIM